MADRKQLNIDACPTPRELESYAAKRLLGTRNEEIFFHLQRCATCLRAMAKLAVVPTPGEIIQEVSWRGWWDRLVEFFSSPGRRGRRH